MQAAPEIDGALADSKQVLTTIILTELKTMSRAERHPIYGSRLSAFEGPYVFIWRAEQHRH